VNLSDAQGWAPLHHAMRADFALPSTNPHQDDEYAHAEEVRRRREVIEALWCAGADVGLPTLDELDEHYTPLHIFARNAVDVSVHQQHYDGLIHVSPLHALTTYLVNVLKFPLGARDAKGETALHVAAEKGLSGEVLLALLDCDAKGEVRAMRNERGCVQSVLFFILF